MTARTQRLYQRDSFLTRFSAEVLDVAAESSDRPESSARIAVLLDRTAFYPTGGGQPHDTGTIGGLPVVDVRDSEEGPLHVVELRGPAGEPHGAHLTVGGRVEGVVDWGRRFDHAQQHSGQHILSRAFVEVAGARTRSFHLGGTVCTVDVELTEPAERTVRAAESRANAIVWEDRGVVVREIPAEESPGGAAFDPVLAGLSLSPGDPIRIVEIEGFDATACGGTHVARTGQVGAAAVTAWEPYKGICRVTFVCGGRVVARLAETGRILGACVSRLSAKPPEVPAALDRVLEEREALRRRLHAAQEDRAALEARLLAAEAGAAGPYRLLRRVFRAPERSVEEAQALVRRFVEEPGRAALVAVVEGDVATILAGRSEGAGPGAPSMGAVLGEACRAAGGRGGGSAAFARGGGIPAARVEEALEAAAARLLSGVPTGRP
jgi:alanyl-tRNA synthetase